jgi:hypothetical protein
MEESSPLGQQPSDDESPTERPLNPVEKFSHKHEHWVVELMTGMLMLGALGIGAFLFLVTLQPRHSEGATRSGKLKWEQRQLEIEQAQRDAQSIIERKS